MTLDPRSPVPKHLQLREILLDLIDGLDPEDPVPSERELASRYGVARMTVRQTVEALVAEGRLFKVGGKGTFVARPKLDLQARLTSFDDEMTRRGMTPSTTVLAFTRLPATTHLAREMSVEVGTDLVYYKRLRSADGAPMSVEQAYLADRLVPGLADTPPPRSLAAALAERYGLVADWGEDTISAASADAELGGLLGIRTGRPVLHIERHSYAGGTRLYYSVASYRADRYQLWVPLARPAPPITNPRR